ncbi:hypothetical protein [Paenibacillus turpanensis]|uniref:hypothetical protein n=1 Tax=Paenibacillus turpanensis TaxID=2689078 RepID=UPI00140C5D5D|nr:hypothetical protein [Paenibacillus turpanensis]
MVESLLVIVGVYGLCVAWVHWIHARSRGEERVPHYILVTHNNQSSIEWVLRLLTCWSWMHGTDVKVTILDAASEDDTLSIIEKRSILQTVEVRRMRNEEDVETVAAAYEGRKDVVITRLSQGESLQRSAAW